MYLHVHKKYVCFLFIQPKVVSGQQLVHSSYLQHLAILAVGLELDKPLCHELCAPHNRNSENSKPIVYKNMMY